MSPARVAPIIGKVRGKLFLAAAGLAALAVYVGLSDSPAPGAPVTQASAPPVREAPQSDADLASRQAAFAISHLGTLRDDADVDPKEPPRQPSVDQKPRPAAAAPPRPAAPPAPRANTQAAAPQTVPLPPPAPAAAPPAQQAAESAKAEKKSSLFGFVPDLPSPSRLIERVSALGDSITSLVRPGK